MAIVKETTKTALGGATMARVKTSNTGQADAMSVLRKCGTLLQSKFVLASGKESDYYFDSKQLTLDPEGALFVADQLLRKLEDEGIEAVGGTAYSAIPIVSHICLYSIIKGIRPIPAFYNRKVSLGHGTNQLAEGKIPRRNAKVAIVEDVVTTGKSLLEAIGQAERMGCNVTNAIVLVDRNEGGKEAVERRGYKFWALFTIFRTPEGQLDIRFNGV